MAAITPYTIEGLQKDISILNIKLYGNLGSIINSNTFI